MANLRGIRGLLSKVGFFYLLFIWEAAFSQPQTGDPYKASLVPKKESEKTVSSALSVAEISATIRKHNDQIGQCFERERKFTRALREHPLARVVIDKNGSVTSCRVATDSERKSPLSGCLCGKIRTWNFPKPRHNQSVTIENIPVIFSTKEASRIMSDSNHVWELVQALEKQLPFTADKLSRLLGIEWPPPNVASSPYFTVFEAVVSAGPYERFIHTAKLQIAGPEGAFENRLGLELKTNVNLSEDDLFHYYDRPQLSVGSPHSTDPIDYLVVPRPWGELAFGCRGGKHDKIISINFSPREDNTALKPGRGK
jgi:hypothetical protein